MKFTHLDYYFFFFRALRKLLLLLITKYSKSDELFYLLLIGNCISRIFSTNMLKSAMILCKRGLVKNLGHIYCLLPMEFYDLSNTSFSKNELSVVQDIIYRDFKFGMVHLRYIKSNKGCSRNS